VETFPPPLLTNKPLIVPFEPLVEIEPVTPKDPVISADPVKGNAAPPLPVLTVIGNVVPLPLVNVIVFEDIDAVVIAFGAKDAVEANEAVPCKEPVNEVAVKEPVILREPLLNNKLSVILIRLSLTSAADISPEVLSAKLALIADCKVVLFCCDILFLFYKY
jgi:hypothetical protein